jgi:hypothetical protein
MSLDDLIIKTLDKIKSSPKADQTPPKQGFIVRLNQNIARYSRKLTPKKHYKEVKTRKGEPGRDPTLGLTDKDIIPAFKEAQQKYIDVWACFQTIAADPEVDHRHLNEMEGLLLDLEAILKIDRDGVIGPGTITGELRELIDELAEANPAALNTTILEMMKDEQERTGATDTELSKRWFQELSPWIPNSDHKAFWSSARSLKTRFNEWKNTRH